MTVAASAPVDPEALATEFAERGALIESQKAIITSLEAMILALQSSLVNHASEIELLKRKLFGPRSERSGTNELQLALGDLLKEQQELQKQLDALVEKGAEDPSAPPPASPPADEPGGQPGPPPAGSCRRASPRRRA